MAGNSKNALLPYHLVVAQSMAGDVTSDPTNIQYTDNCCIQANFTGTPTGVFAVQGSVDHAEYALTHEVLVTGNWVTITTGSASGSAGLVLFDLNQLSFPWVRLIYTRTSGTGTLDAYIGSKAV